jgi:hypothetical protein
LLIAAKDIVFDVSIADIVSRIAKE